MHRGAPRREASYGYNTRPASNRGVSSGFRDSSLEERRARRQGTYDGRPTRRAVHPGYDRQAPRGGRARRHGPGPRRSGAPVVPSFPTIVGFCAVAIVLVVGLVMWNNRSVQIQLNGTTTSVKVSSSIADIVSAKRFTPKAGNLVSVSGKTLTSGQGYPYSVKLGDEDLSQDAISSYKAKDGDVLTIGDGADKTEDYDVRIVEEQPKLEMGGDAWGNITYISQWGQVGKHEVRTGKVSGETADGDVIQETKNVVVSVHQIKPDDSSRKLIALTFDDGPAESYTEKYLSILDQYGIKATFFNLGENIKEYPDLAKKVVDSGNEIMSHTQQHQQLSKLDQSALQSEFSNAFSQIESTTGVQTTSFRPPYGDFTESAWLRSGGLASLSVLWNLDSEDWRRAGSDSIVQKATSGAFSGAIILMHDGGGDRSQDVEALPQIIETLQSEGYEFVTVTDLMKSDSSIPEDIANGDAQMPSDSVWPTEIAKS